MLPDGQVTPLALKVTDMGGSVLEVDFIVLGAMLIINAPLHLPPDLLKTDKSVEAAIKVVSAL